MARAGERLAEELVEKVLREAERLAAARVCGPERYPVKSENEWNAWCVSEENPHEQRFVAGGYERYLLLKKQLLKALLEAVEEELARVRRALREVGRAYEEVLA